MRFKHSYFWFAGILALTACVLVLGWEEIKELLWQANPNVLALLCLLQVGTLALSAYKWHFLLAKLAPGYSFGRVFAVYLGGDFVESITPAVKLGGEAARVYLFRRLTSLPYTQLTGKSSYKNGPPPFFKSSLMAKKLGRCPHLFARCIPAGPLPRHRPRTAFTIPYIPLCLGPLPF